MVLFFFSFPPPKFERSHTVIGSHQRAAEHTPHGSFQNSRLHPADGTSVCLIFELDKCGRLGTFVGTKEEVDAFLSDFAVL